MKEENIELKEYITQLIRHIKKEIEFTDSNKDIDCFGAEWSEGYVDAMQNVLKAIAVKNYMYKINSHDEI